MFLLFTLITIFVITYFYFKYVVKKQICSQTFSLVKEEAKDLDNYIINIKKFLKLFSKELKDNGLIYNLDNLPKNFYNHLTLLHINSIFLLNPEGKLLSSYPHYKKGSTVLLDPEEFKKAIFNGKEYIPTPFILSITSKPSIVVCEPINLQNNQISAFCGAINILDKNNPFGELIDRKIGKTGYMYLFAKDRTLIVHATTSRILKRDVPPGANEMFDKALEGFEGAGETINSKGMNTFVAFKRMNTTGWIVAANYPKKDAYEFFGGFKRNYILLAIIILLFAVLISVFITNLILRPLTRVADKIKRLVTKDFKKWDDLEESEFEEINVFLSTLNMFLKKIKEKEKLLEESEARYRRLIETFPEIAFETDLTGRVTYLNRSGMKILALTYKDLEKGINVFDLVHPDFLKQAQYAFKEALEGRRRKYFEYKLKRKDGTIFYAREISFPIKRDGKVVGIFGFAMDITYYKKIQREILDLNQRLLDANIRLSLFEKAVENSPLSVVITNKDGIIEYVNPLFIKLTGYSKEEVIGKRPSILKSGVHSEEFYKKLWNTILSGKEWVGELCNKKKNGEIFWEKAFISSIKNEEGEITHFVGIKEDITEAKKKDEELNKALKEIEEANRRLTSILDTQESIVILMDKDKRTIYINRRFFELFPYKDLEEFLAKHKIVCELFKEKEGYLPKCQGKPEEYMLKNFSDKGSKLAIMEDKWGNERIFSVYVKEISSSYQKLFVITLSEVTELEKARQMAIWAERSKMEFLANMSHEIRTPLNAIVGFMDLLSRTNLSLTQFRYITIIKTAIESLLNIVNSVLDFAKIDAGKVEIEYMEVNPYIEFEKILLLFKSLASNKRISYTYNLDYKLHECLVMGLQALKQVLMNLINNSLKFTPEGGKVKVTIELEKDLEEAQKVRFLIEDTGIGIPKEKLPVIFNRFTQADFSITRKYRGTGLGLSISYSLVKLMGGELCVESKEGEGSKFFFSLPFKKCFKGDFITSILKNTKVLVFLRDDKVAEEIEKFLRAWGVNYRKVDSINGIYKKFDVGIFSNQEDLNLCLSVAEKVIFIGEKDHLVDDKRVIVIDSPKASQIYNALISACLPKSQEIKRIDDNKEKEKFKLRILVAEDNPVNQMLLSELLKEYGVEADFVEDGEEAVKAVDKEDYDLVLMDIDMPKMDGLEATRIIKKKKPYLPIVALTAHVIPEMKESFLKAGMDDYIPKPIERDHLKKVFEKIDFYVKKNQTEKMKRRDIDEILEEAQNSLGLSFDKVEKIFHKFLDSLNSYLKELEMSFKNRDLNKIKHIAHTIKGMAYSVRAKEISDLAKSLEEAAKENNFDEVSRLIGKLEDISKNLIQEFLKRKESGSE